MLEYADSLNNWPPLRIRQTYPFPASFSEADFECFGNKFSRAFIVDASHAPPPDPPEETPVQFLLVEKTILWNEHTSLPSHIEMEKIKWNPCHSHGSASRFRAHQETTTPELLLDTYKKAIRRNNPSFFELCPRTICLAALREPGGKIVSVRVQ